MVQYYLYNTIYRLSFIEFMHTSHTSEQEQVFRSALAAKVEDINLQERQASKRNPLTPFLELFRKQKAIEPRKKYNPLTDQNRVEQLRAVLKQIATELYVITPETESVALGLSVELREQFPTLDIQLVIFGSRAKGGNALKEVYGSEFEKSDFDYGVIINGAEFISIDDFVNIQEYWNAKKEREILLKQIHSAVKKHLKELGFKPCQGCNAKNFYVPTLTTTESATAVLLHFFGLEAYNQTTEYNYHGLLYFFPTYPKEKWIDNLKLLERALSQLQKKDPQKYAVVSRNMLAYMKYKSAFKPGHFSIFTDIHGLVTDNQPAKEASMQLTQLAQRKTAAQFPVKLFEMANQK